MYRLAFALALLFLQVPLSAQTSRTIRGTVVDDRTGAPIRGARVQAAGDTSALTDDRGRFTLTFLNTAPFQMVQVAKPGFATTPVMVGTVEGGITLPLRRGGVLVIRVLDEFNEPKRGMAGIAAMPDTGAMMMQQRTLDDRGEWRVPNLAPGTYRIRVGGILGQLVSLPPTLDPADVPRLRDEVRRLAATLPSDAGQTDATAVVRPDEETVLFFIDAAPLNDTPVIDVSKGRAAMAEEGHAGRGTAVVRGRVALPDGRPIAGARVSVRGDGFSIFATTDREGQYALTGLPAGTLRLGAAKPGFMPLSIGETPAASTPPVTLGSGEQREIDAVLAPASNVSGAILDEYGDPVFQAKILLVAAGPSSALPKPVARAATDERGRFEIRGVPPGDYFAFTDGETAFPGEVHTFHPGRLSLAGAEIVRVEEGLDVENLTLRIDRSLGARVQGTALDVNGTPMAGRALQIAGIESTGSPVIPRVSRTSRSGAFEFRNVSPGTYEISFQGTTTAALVTAILGFTPAPDPMPVSGRITIEVGDSAPPPVTLRANPSP